MHIKKRMITLLMKNITESVFAKRSTQILRIRLVELAISTNQMRKILVNPFECTGQVLWMDIAFTYL